MDNIDNDNKYTNDKNYQYILNLHNLFDDITYLNDVIYKEILIYSLDCENHDFVINKKFVDHAIQILQNDLKKEYLNCVDRDYINIRVNDILNSNIPILYIYDELKNLIYSMEWDYLLCTDKDIILYRLITMIIRLYPSNNMINMPKHAQNTSVYMLNPDAIEYFPKKNTY